MNFMMIYGRGNIGNCFRDGFQGESGDIFHFSPGRPCLNFLPINSTARRFPLKFIQITCQSLIRASKLLWKWISKLEAIEAAAAEERLSHR